MQDGFPSDSVLLHKIGDLRSKKMNLFPEVHLLEKGATQSRSFYSGAKKGEQRKCPINFVGFFFLSFHKLALVFSKRLISRKVCGYLQSLTMSDSQHLSVNV